MRTLLEDGIDKAAQGLTTLDEVLRVVSRANATRSGGAAPPAEQRCRRGSRPTRRSRRAAAAGGRVLVVEDSPTIVSVVKYFLELEGFEVLVAENGLRRPRDGAPGASRTSSSATSTCPAWAASRW